MATLPPTASCGGEGGGQPRTKRAGIVLGMNEVLSKQTPREGVAWPIAACVSPDRGPHPSQRVLEGRDEAFTW